MDYRKVLKSTLITEKTSKLMEMQNKYTFKIAKTATKGQVKEAVEKLYDVGVIGVKVLNNGPKMKRSMVGRRKPYSKKGSKKAIVELKQGDNLKVYEGSQ